MKMFKNIAKWMAVFLVIISHNIFAETIAPPVAPPPVAAIPAPTAPVAASPVTAPSEVSESRKTKSNSWEPENQWIIYGVILSILGGGFFILSKIISALSNSKWSLADALSEEASVVSLESDGKPRLGADGKPIMVTELRASSSRMIAFVGMVLILLMFLGFGIFSIFSFAKTGEMPKPDNIVNFLAAGMTLFAPYLVNQFSAIFEKLAPKKS